MFTRSNYKLSYPVCLAKCSPQWTNGYGFQGKGSSFGFFLNLWTGSSHWASDRVLTQENTFKDSKWYHWAATYDEKTLKLYRNGELVSQKEIYETIKHEEREGLTIGFTEWDSKYYYFYGDIAEVRIWNYARTADEIRATQDRVLSGKENGLVLYYKFQQGLRDGSTVVDFSRYGNHGKVIGKLVCSKKIVV